MTICCPFCAEPDFDLVGLKSHLSKGECEVFEKTESVVSPFDAPVYECCGKIGNHASWCNYASGN